MVIYLFTLFIFIFNNLFYKNKLTNLEEGKEGEVYNKWEAACSDRENLPP